MFAIFHSPLGRRAVGGKSTHLPLSLVQFVRRTVVNGYAGTIFKERKQYHRTIRHPYPPFVRRRMSLRYIPMIASANRFITCPTKSAFPDAAFCRTRSITCLQISVSILPSLYAGSHHVHIIRPMLSLSLSQTSFIVDASRNIELPHDCCPLGCDVA